MNTITYLAHAGHDHSMDTTSAIDHCMPIIIGCGIAIIVLLAVIVYLLTNWQPKTSSKSPKPHK